MRGHRVLRDASGRGSVDVAAAFGGCGRLCGRGGSRVAARSSGSAVRAVLVACVLAFVLLGAPGFARASTVVASDSFGRTVTHGWGSASTTGGAYTLYSTTVADYNVDGSAATMRNGAGNTRSAWLASTATTDVNSTVTFSIDKVPTGTNTYVYLVARRTAAADEYHGVVRLQPNGAVCGYVTQTIGGGTETTIGSAVLISGLTVAANTKFHARLVVTGTSPTSLSLTIWADGSTEPGTPQVSQTDSTSVLQATGAVGLRAYAGATVSNGPITAKFDDWTATTNAPADTSAPAITGTLSPGATQTVSNGSWTNTPTGYTYQWTRDGTPISGATSSTYSLGSADAGHAVAALVTATNASGFTDALAASVTPPAIPAIILAPAITNTVASGQTLSVSTGTWSGSPTTYTYQWYRDGTAVFGATSSTYAITSGDLGHTFKARVTAADSLGWSATADSQTLAPPANTTAPAITGTVHYGNTLTVSNGSWSPSASTYAYQWYRDDTAHPISGATSSTHVIVTAGDAGHTIFARVTATNADGATPSDATGDALVAAPVATIAPTISGTVASGHTLTATAGTWSGSPTLSEQWYRSGSAISGATSLTHAIVSGDIGAPLKLTVSAENAGGLVTADTPTLNPPANTTAPAISGTLTIGQTLTASHGAWSNSPTEYYFQWTRGGTNISGATHSTHILVTADAGTSLGVIVTAKDADGATPQNASATSIPAVPAITTAPATSGSVSTGGTLSTSTGSWSGSPSSYAYQWQRDGVDIDGAQSSSYAVTDDDLGHAIRAVVTASNTTGPGASANSNTLNPPADSVLPSITGSVTLGATLTAGNGTWTNSPTTYDHQWYNDGVAISGATAGTYVVQSGDVGHTIDVIVKATNADGATKAGTLSAPTITLGAAPDDPSSIGATSTAWTSGGFAATTTCSVDGGAFSSCSSPATPTVTTGRHSVVVRVSNDAGSATSTARWTAVDGTIVNGTIASDTTWTTGGSPYIVVNATLSSSATLTIDPGVVVKGYAASSTLTIDGNLYAVGTTGSPIVFTSIEDDAADSVDSTGDGSVAPHSGDWGHLLLDGIGKTYDIEHSAFEYGGGAGSTDQAATLKLTHGSATISHDTLTESSVSGIAVDGGTDGTAATAAIDNTKLANNHFDGLTVTQAEVDISDSVLIQNGQDGIDYAFTPDYAGTAGSADSNQIWANAAFGVHLQTGDGGFPDNTLPDDGGAPDGTLPNGSANNIYDNGLDAKADGSQFNADDVRPDTDWSNNYWGTAQAASGAAGITCANTDPDDGYGVPEAANPHHLWGGATDPYFAPTFPILVGPVSSYERTWDSDGYSGTPPESPYQYTHYVGFHGEPNQYTNGCQDDDVTDTPAASSIFDIPGVTEPPPVSGGIPDNGTYGGCLPCYLDSHPHHNLLNVPNVRRGDPVDTATGALQEEFTDARMPGPGDPFIWMRAYTSDDPNVGILGMGWSTGYSDRLVINGDGSVTYTTETGQQQVFTLDPDTGAYDAPSGATSNLWSDGVTGDYTLETQDNTSYVFDTTGLLQSITPLNKPATSFAYTSGQLTSITDSAGRTTTLTYNELEPSLLSRVTLPDGRYVEYGYDDDQLVSVRDLRGKTTTYTYDAAGRLATITDPDGHRTLDTHYDATTGRVDWQKDAYDHETTFAWDPATGTSTTTDPNGNATIDAYYKNVLISTTDGRGKTTTYGYDANLKASTTMTATGQVTTTKPDQFGNIVERCIGATSPLCTTSTYNEDNQLASTTTPRGKTTTYSYDDSDHLIAVDAPDGGETDYTYDPTTGEVATMTDPRGKVSTYTYDGQGNLASRTSPLGFETTYGYDSTGRRTSMVEARGNISGATAANFTWHYTYDNADNPLTTTDPYSDSTANTYDNAGNKVTQTDARGKTMTYAYDDQNRVTSVTDPNAHATTYTYDDAGNLASQTDPVGGKTTYTYDADNKVHTKVMPRGNATGATASDYTYTYAYDNDERLTSITDPTSHTNQSSYDAYGRIHVQTDELGDTTTYAYDDDGDVTTKTDGVGNDATYTYDDNDRLLSSTDERGKTTTYGYDLAGNQTSTTSALGEMTTETYDDDGRLASTVDPRGNATGATAADFTTTYAYDASGNRTSTTDPLSHATTYTYDRDGRLATKTDASSHAWAYSYLADGSLSTETNPLTGVTTYTYDDAGNVASVTDPVGNKTTYTYTADDLVHTKVLPRGNATGATASDYTYTYAYDADGNQTSVADPATHTELESYDKLDRVATTTDELGNVTTLTRDAAGNLTRSDDALGDHVDYTYDQDNRLLTSADERGKTTTYVYTAAGALASSTTPLGEKTKYTYDDDERLATTIDPRGNVTGGVPADYTTTYGYDEAGNETSVTDALGDETTYAYDHAGELSSTTDANTHTTTYTYYANGDLHTQTAPDTGVTTYAYDGLDDLTSKQDARAHTTTSTYDTAGELLSTTDPLSNETTYTYDPDGNQATKTTPIGNASMTPSIGRISYTYDKLDQLTDIAYGDGTHSVSYGYDTAGNRTSMSDSGGSVSYTYDAANRLTAATRGTQAFGYTLDADGQTTTLTQPDSSTVTYAYDNDERLSTVIAASATTTYSYDAASNPIGVAFPNGVTETDAYDHAGRLTNVTNMSGSTVLSEFARTFDPVGNPTLVATTRGTTTTNEAFAYDANDRVLKDCSATSCTGTPDQIAYTYDKEGNQLTLARTSSGTTTTTTSTYDNANQLTSSVTGGTATNYTYDADGNQLTAGTARTNTFNIADELTSTSNGTTTTSYTFDGDQNRLSAMTGSSVTKFLWNTNTGDLPQLALTTDGSGTTIHKFTYGLGAITSDAGYLQHDLAGSISDVTDASGTPQWLFSYEPFGTTKAATSLAVGAVDEPLRYAGGYLDAESGNYYLNAREYDPNQSRFISRDPLTPVAGESDYSYASNDPMLLIDPTGMSWYNPADDVDSVKHYGGEAASAATTGARAVGSVAVDQVTSAADPWDSNGRGVWGAVGVETDIVLGPLYPAYHLAVKTGLLPAAAQPYEDAYSSHGGGFDGAVAVGELASGVTNAVNGYHDLEQGDYLGALGNGAIVGASLIPCGRGAVVARDAAIGVLAKDAAEVTASDRLPLQMHHFATNKNLTYTPRMYSIAQKYGLDLDGPWNKELMRHLGRHPNDYHDFVLRAMRNAADSAGSDKARFLQLFEEAIRQPIRQNPSLLRKAGWQ